MATAAKRAVKLQEFVAHGGNVNCAALGHDSGRVLVSGGEDKKVNLWAVGKTNCILSLSGHTSPVEAVRFRPDEKVVLTGSLSGAIKIWDLEAVKILRTLTGHKSAIRCLDYHPFNDIILTGSADTTIKVWDMRRKSCLYTYAGHSNCVNCVRFSPDAQWMASGGEDNLIKIWDMSAGKQLAQFRQHSGPVNTVQFHPNELLLASGSSDRTVKFWDLESMQMVGTTDGDCTPVRSLLFHPNGEFIYTATLDFLKVYGWEPSRCFDSVSVGWGRPSDIATVDTQLVGVSFSQSSLSTFVIDIQKVQPLGGPAYQNASNVPPQASTSVHRRRSFIAERPSTHCGPMKISEDEAMQNIVPDDDNEENASGVEIGDMMEYTQVFRPRHELSRDIGSSSVTQDSKKLPFTTNKQLSSSNRRQKLQGTSPARHDECSSEKDAPSSSVASSTARPQPTSSHAYLPPEVRPKRPQTSSSKSARSNCENAKENTGTCVKSKRPIADNVESKLNSENRGPVKDRTTRGIEEDTAESKQKQSLSRENVSILPDRFRISDDVTSNTGRPLFRQGVSPNQTASCKQLDVDEFFPRPIVPSGDITESTAIESISGGHDAFIAVMSARYKKHQVIKAMWTEGNIKTAIEAAVGMNDPAVVHDVVNTMLQKMSTWSLDHCTSLLPILGDLIMSKYGNYVDTGLKGIKLMLRSFADIIKAHITAPPPVGVDISREERTSKCQFCYKELMKIRSELERRPASGEKLQHCKEIQLLMNQLD